MTPLSTRPRSIVRALRDAGDRTGLALLIALACYALVPVALALCPSLSLELMARFHLRTPSFASWLAAQPAPWMYNFENRYLVSDRPLIEAELDQPPLGMRWHAANHQPARAFTFADGRARFLAEPGERYFYLESRYRGYRLRTAYRARVAEPSALGTAHVTVARLERR